MNMLEYLEQCHHWHVDAHRSTAYRLGGYCPRHSERTPSFSIDLREVPYHFHCFGCALDGTGLYGMVRWLEFDGRDDQTSRQQIAARVRDMGGDSQLPYIPRSIAPGQGRYAPDLLPLPTQEQQQCMTIAHTWWREQLFANGTHARAIREYITERGLHLDFVEYTGRLGYAPYAREGSQHYRSLCQRLADVCGADWHTLAISVGILSQDGKHVRNQHRLISAQIADTAQTLGQGMVQVYIGRAMDPQNPYKFLLPPNIRKVPFSIPVAHPVIEGVTIVEGTIEALILAQPDVGYSGMHQIAMIGQGTIPIAYFKQWTGTKWIATNNDVLKPVKQRDGTDVLERAGERMAQALIKRFQQEGITDYCRVMVPTTDDKDVDKYVRQKGIWSWLDRYPREVALAM